MSSDNFGEWLTYQQHRQDEVGKFARLIWDDYNGGCSNYYFPNAIPWRDHFQSKHANKFDLIFPLLQAAYKEYILERTGNTTHFVS
jgi:hypothetical protein